IFCMTWVSPMPGEITIVETSLQTGKSPPFCGSHWRSRCRRAARRLSMPPPRIVPPGRSSGARSSGHVDDEDLSRTPAAVSCRVDGHQVDEILLAAFERVVSAAQPSIQVVLARKQEELLSRSRRDLVL